MKKSFTLFLCLFLSASWALAVDMQAHWGTKEAQQKAVGMGTAGKQKK